MKVFGICGLASTFRTRACEDRIESQSYKAILILRPYSRRLEALKNEQTGNVRSEMRLMQVTSTTCRNCSGSKIPHISF